MRSLRRAAVAAVCFTLGAALVASPSTALAEPANGARPDIVNSAGDAAPGQLVGKDADGRTIVYVEGAREDELRAAVTKAGGVVADTDEGRVKAAVPGDKLDQVASQPGVTEVRLPDRAVPMSITSAGVGLSKADQWIAAGKKGAGVKVGVIDIGFGGLTNAQDAGELPTGDRLVVNNSNCIDGSVKKPHGTAVAEIIHDMAPDAQLYLACIEDTVSFSAAEQWLRGQGVQIISAAVGFLSPSGGRGDGTGPVDSPADVVKRSREAGILWSVAAGNQGRLHFGGKAVDANADKWVEYEGTTQNKGIPVKPTATATIGIRWDAWPKTTEDLDLYVMTTGQPPVDDNDPRIVAKSTRPQKDTAGGLSPNEEVSFTNSGDPAITRTYWVFVKNNNAKFTTPFDLFVGGDVDGQLQNYTSERSVTEPGTSPYVLTVGATAANSGVLQSTSGRGPTIDGRQKPDITGFDTVATSSVSTFQGTSAAAAHVAGAAAVLKSANPALDAAQLQAALQSKASPKKSDNGWGNGTLHLGTPDTVPTFSGSGFTVLQTQPRIHTKFYAPGETATLPSFETVPGDTTAVALTISGRSDVDTTLDIFPAGAADTSRPTSLQVRGGQQFTSLTAFVPLGTARSIKIRNRAGTTGVVVEFLGYFSPGESTDFYTAKVTPQRVLDTRGFVGSPRNTPLKNGDDQDIPIRGVAGVPADATSVVVNLTGFEASSESFLGLFGDNQTGITALSIAQAQRRSNLAVVPIGSNGKIRLHNFGGGQAGVAVDVVGWFAPGSGSRYVTLPETARLADTATGTGLPKEPIGQGQSAAVQVKGMAGVSSSSVVAALTVTGTEDQFGTELTVSPSERGWSPVTNFGSRQREPMAGLVLSPLDTSGKVDVRNERGRAQVSVDVSGYFIGGPPLGAPPNPNCVPAKDAAGFTSVFDGRLESDIAGWQVAGTKPIKVEGCELATDTGDDVTWYGARSYANDYTLKLDWLATTDNSESGVFVGFPNPAGDKNVPGTRGMEINIGPRGATGNLQTGGFVGLQAPSTTAPVKPNGQWNTFEITVRLNMVTVVLNGTKVNEYAMADSARVNLNSYIGLQNNKIGDQVRFRNVRMKRDTPVRSGTFAAAGKCLDVWANDVYQPIVVMHACHGAFNQTWTTSGDGGILAGGRCLAAEGGGTANGTLVLLNGCDGNDSEQWILRQDGRIVNPPSRRCLTPVPGDPETRLQLQDCATGRSEQVFQTPDQRGRSGKVAGPGGNCLDVPNNDPRTGNLALWTCNGSVAQMWAMTGDGTVRADGKCLDVKESGTADGTPVTLFECNGTQAQQWVGNADGTLVNPRSGRCLTSTSEAAGATLAINDCTAPSRQSWRLSADTVMRGALVGYGSKCLDVAGNDPNGTGLWYFQCFGPGGQLFWNNGDGAFRAYGKCLDIDSTDNRTPVRLAACNGVASQQWVSRPDGTILNILANRNLDLRDANTADGATVQIHDFNGSYAQRWSIPVKSS